MNPKINQILQEIEKVVVGKNENAFTDILHCEGVAIFSLPQTFPRWR